jgi:hypothetical protein
MSLKTFWEWFDIEISPTLIDLSDADGSSDFFDKEEESNDTIH